jgi:hypothetical protein
MQHVIVNHSHKLESGLSAFVRRVGHWVGFLVVAMAVARERRALLQLDDKALKDIGLGRADAYAEGSRPFSDVPTSRYF